MIRLQLPTHVTFGILIQLLLYQIYHKNDIPFLIIVFLLALLSHFILDSLAIMTYHPPERQHTNFWLYWHIFVYVTGIIFILISLLINPLFIVGIIGANLPDLWDWVFLRWLLKSKNKKLYIHKYANKIRSLFKSYVPDLSYNKLGIIPESILYSVVYFSIAFYFI